MFEGEAAYFVDEPAEYEPRGEHIVAKWKGMEFVMPIPVARKAALRLQEALAKWHLATLEKGSVVQFPRAPHAAA